MQVTETAPPIPGAVDSRAADSLGRASGRSWMVWLRSRVGEELTPRRAGLERDREAVALGRCLLVLPEDDVAFSWCRRGQQVAFLYGHLFNREELRQRLELPAADAPTDAELLLLAYEAWGADTARELDGAFIALVWDEPNDTLLCIRDAIGLMPLFYSRPGADLVLSSDVWTLLRHVDVSREVDRLVVAEHLLWQHPVVEETCFQQVRRVPTGHRLLARGAELTVVRHWDPAPLGQPIDWLSREELDRFPELMYRTVASHMALGPAAVSLSAGIDSVSVAAFAVQVAEETGLPRPHALSLYSGPGADPASDESPVQTAVAHALGMPFSLFTSAESLSGRRPIEAAVRLSQHYPTPLGNMVEPRAMFLMEVARSRGIRVMLTGSGGDEWLGVTPFLAADLIRAGDIAGLWRLYRSGMRSYHRAPIRFAHRLLWSFGLRPLLKDTAFRYFPGWAARRRPPAEPPDWLAPDPELRRRVRERIQPPPPPVGSSFYRRELEEMTQTWMMTWDLEEIYYRTHGRGITYLHPYWSRPLSEFLLRVPPSLLNAGGRAKSPARRALAERFPDLGFEKQKKYIDASGEYARTIAAEWSDIWRQCAPDSALARAGIADAPALEQAMQTAAASRSRVWWVPQWLSTEAWLRAHL